MLGALMLLQGLLVPALEATDAVRGAVLESEHSVATCVSGHDHSICVQTGANRTLGAGAIRHHLPVLAISFAAPPGTAMIHSAGRALGHSTRAPPAST
jgi:hypothetical protein